MLSGATEPTIKAAGGPGGRDQGVTGQSVNKHEPNKILLS